MRAAAVLPVTVKDAYRFWSVSYDDDPNPILALERRVIRERLGALSGKCVLDVATGTGYWLAHAKYRRRPRVWSRIFPRRCLPSRQGKTDCPTACYAPI